MTPRSLLTFFLAAVTTIAAGQKIPRPDVPGKISAPQNERVVLATHASGFQVYVCDAAADGQWAWTLKAPEAELLDARGVMVGRHYAGPTWKHNDGSAVVGKMQAKVDFPDLGAVPWLLLVATGHSGNGVLSHVTTVQRIHTKGGQPPPSDGCTASHRGIEAKSGYTADYYFYAPSQ
jgi:hypothetical protein